MFVCVCVAGPLVSAAEASGGSSKKVYLVLVVSAFFFFFFWYRYKCVFLYNAHVESMKLLCNV